MNGERKKSEDVREAALARVFANFEEKLQEAIGSFHEADITDDEIEIVRNKYRNAFQNYFTAGFDQVFQKEIAEKIINEAEKDAAVHSRITCTRL